MSRQEFMTRLERLLWEVPECDRLDAIAYYNDYFAEAGPENEEKVILELGSPEKVAATIKGEALEDTYVPKKSVYGEYTERGYSEKEGFEKGSDRKNSSEWRAGLHRENTTAVTVARKNTPWPIIVILIIIGAPILIGIAGGLLGVLVGLVGGAIGVVAGVFGAGVGLTIGGIVCLVVGVVRIFAIPMEGLTSMGVGALLTAIGLVFVVLFVWLVGSWIPALVRGLINGCKKVYDYIRRRLGKDEKIY